MMNLIWLINPVTFEHKLMKAHIQLLSDIRNEAIMMPCKTLERGRSTIAISNTASAMFDEAMAQYIATPIGE